jgi:diacylglycerol kinase family enzyme
MLGTKTRVALIHNGGAGDASHGRDWLLDVLSRAGYEVDYYHHKSKAVAAALDSAAELIAVAGGDGTVAGVAAQARPEGPPIAILPLGTANNIAASLGLGADIEALVAGWRRSTVRPFYPIDSYGPWGSRRLIEGLGFGAIEEAIAGLPDTIDHKAACRSYAKEVMTDDPESLELTLDGETIRERFAVLEIAVIPLVGPNLRLVPAADPSGRDFAVSFIRDTVYERRALAAWIVAPKSDTAPPVILRTATRATIAGRFQRVRIDGDVHTATEEPGWDLDAPITLTSAAEPLRFLLPD